MYLLLSTTVANKEALDILLEQGVLGAVSVLLISAVIYLVRSLQKSHKDRVTDLQSYTESIKNQNAAMSDLVREVNQSNSQISQDTALSNQEVLGMVEDMRREVNGALKTLDDLKTQQVRLESAITYGRNSNG